MMTLRKAFQFFLMTMSGFAAKYCDLFNDDVKKTLFVNMNALLIITALICKYRFF